MTKPKQTKTTAKPNLPGTATTPRKPTGQFVKGHKPTGAGRAKGQRNRATVMLKDAILTAAALAGEDGKGKGELIGYLKMLALREKRTFARLLEKVLPMQLHVRDKTNEKLTPNEAVERLRERGLIVPPSLLQLTTVAHALNDQREDGETDDLDNRVYQRDGLDDLEEE